MSDCRFGVSPVNYPEECISFFWCLSKYKLHWIVCKVNEPNVVYTSINSRIMMFIAYIYFLFYLEIDEQFGITAKIEAEKELHADFLLKADQRLWRHDVSDVRSDCRESWFILTSFTAGHLRSFWALISISGDDIGKMLMFCENETIGIQIKFSWSRKSHLKLNIIRHEIWIMNFCRPLFWSQPMYL